MQHRSLFAFSLLAILGCSNDPAMPTPDGGMPPDDDAGPTAEDAGAVTDDAPSCPTPTAGRWVIRTDLFSYDGPDCRPEGIDGEYHPTAFTVAGDGTFGCECDTTPSTCNVGFGGLGSSCEILLTCGDPGTAGPSMYVYFTSPTMAEVREKRLVNGDCVANGAFTPE